MIIIIHNYNKWNNLMNMNNLLFKLRIKHLKEILKNLLKNLIFIKKINIYVKIIQILFIKMLLLQNIF